MQYIIRAIKIISSITLIYFNGQLISSIFDQYNIYIMPYILSYILETKKKEFFNVIFELHRIII